MAERKFGVSEDRAHRSAAEKRKPGSRPGPTTLQTGPKLDHRAEPGAAERDPSQTAVSGCEIRLPGSDFSAEVSDRPVAVAVRQPVRRPVVGLDKVSQPSYSCAFMRFRGPLSVGQHFLAALAVRSAIVSEAHAPG